MPELAKPTGKPALRKAAELRPHIGDDGVFVCDLAAVLGVADEEIRAAALQLGAPVGAGGRIRSADVTSLSAALARRTAPSCASTPWSPLRRLECLVDELATRGRVRAVEALSNGGVIIGLSTGAKMFVLDVAHAENTIQIVRAAKGDGLLILGERGVGKEAAARLAHAASGRSGEFVAINCGAVSEAMFEGEFFGHMRGAFTGAQTDRQGLFEKADGGTLFLDEIGELPTEQQAKLLRAIQERAVRRIGSYREVPVDVMIVAGTNRPLREMVDAGAFRGDLFDRISHATAKIPPLRERRVEILPLALLMLSNLPAGKVKLSASVVPMLLAHDWPGNVRELQNVLRGATLGLDDDDLVISPRHIERVLGPITCAKPLCRGRGRPVETTPEQRQAIVVAPASLRKIAAQIGVSKSTIERIKNAG